jgi:hypothetical protein
MFLSPLVVKICHYREKQGIITRPAMLSFDPKDPAPNNVVQLRKEAA